MFDCKLPMSLTKHGRFALGVKAFIHQAIKCRKSPQRSDSSNHFRLSPLLPENFKRFSEVRDSLSLLRLRSSMYLSILNLYSLEWLWEKDDGVQIG